MNLTDLNKIMESDEWANKEGPMSDNSMKRKIAGFQHEAELYMKKIYDWVKRAPGKVFVTSMKKGGTTPQPPTAIAANPNAYMSLSIIDTINNEQIITRIYVTKTDVPLVRTIRKLIERHNDLTNKQSEFAGKMIGKK